MIITLATVEQNDQYTQSLLHLPDTVLHIIEPPWVPSPDHRGGLNDQSCVPAGRYRLVPHNGGKWKHTWALVNPDLDVYHLPGDRPNGLGRFALVFHRGVHVGNTDGCPLVGLDSTPGRLLNGPKAERILRDTLRDGEHELEIIRPCFGG